MPGREGYAVIGLGLFGSSIARTLAAMGHHVLALDWRLAAVEALGSVVAESVQGDATDRAVLEALHLERYTVVFNTIGDLSASILCTLVLKEIGVKRVIAKINSTQQGRILTRLGAESILFPERDMGERVAMQVGAGASAITAHIDLSPEASILEIPVPPLLVRRTLAEADLRRHYGVTVIAVKKRREGEVLAGEVIVSPPADLVFGANDLVLVAGKNEDLLRLERAGRGR